VRGEDGELKRQREKQRRSDPEAVSKCPYIAVCEGSCGNEGRRIMAEGSCGGGDEDDVSD